MSGASLAMISVAGVRLIGRKFAVPREPARRHARIQQRVLLTFITAGVLSSFQWLVFFMRYRLGIDHNAVLQAIDWLLFAAAVAQLAYGWTTLILSQRRARAADAAARAATGGCGRQRRIRNGIGRVA